MASRGTQIFISYQWNSQAQVEIFADFLKRKYSVWFDIVTMAPGDRLFNQISDGIKESDTFLCFITKAYFLSDNCRKEITFANTLKKPIIPIMLEHVPMDGEVGFIINSLIRVNAYSDPNLFINLNGPIVNQILIGIERALDNKVSENIDAPPAEPVVSF